MLWREIEIAAVGDTFDFAEARRRERELIFDVWGSQTFFGVVRKLVSVVHRA